MDREKPPILIFCFAIGAAAIGGAGLLLAWLFPPEMQPLDAAIMRGSLWFVVALSTFVGLGILPDEPAWWAPLSWIVHLRRLCYGPFGYLALVLFTAIILGTLALAGAAWYLS